MTKKILFIFVIFLGSLNLYALDILAGVNFKTTSVDVQQNEVVVAEFYNKGNPIPAIGLRTELNYFNFNNKESSLGYFYQFDFTFIKLDEQETDGELKNYGTSLKGYSFLAAPTLFYHFNKDSKWSQKIGFGLGLGFLKLAGDFEITKKDHGDYSQIYEIDLSAPGSSGGFIFEISSENHSFILQNFGPNLATDEYIFTQNNIDLMYRYKFSLDF